MKTLALDLRERILASYDNLEGTRQEIADRYRFAQLEGKTSYFRLGYPFAV